VLAEEVCEGFLWMDNCNFRLFLWGLFINDVCDEIFWVFGETIVKILELLA
jgi:hypothetical protein